MAHDSHGMLLPRGRSTRYALLFRRRPAGLRYGGGCGYGGRFHAQKRRQLNTVELICSSARNVHAGYVRQIINLTQTTSGSYLLMSSLDISRRNLALRGRKVFASGRRYRAEYAREEINAVGGYYALSAKNSATATPCSISIRQSSASTRSTSALAGIEVYDILRDEYDIQIEFGDIGNILAYLSIGDRPQEVERLVKRFGRDQAPVQHGREPAF